MQNLAPLFAHTHPEPGPRLLIRAAAELIGMPVEHLRFYVQRRLVHFERVENTRLGDPAILAPTDVAAAAILGRFFKLNVRDRAAATAVSVALYGWSKEQLPQKNVPACCALWRSDEVAERWTLDLRKLSDGGNEFWRGWLYPADDPPAMDALMRRFDLVGGVVVPVSAILRPLRETLCVIEERAERQRLDA